MRIEEIYNLFEKTFDLDDQVDFIYNNYFADYVEQIQKGPGLPDLKPITIKSTDLPESELMAKANELNPVVIKIHVDDTNVYLPLSSQINLGFSGSAWGFTKQQGSLKRALSLLLDNGYDNQYKRLKNEFTETRVKGSIYHELSHWLDDTLHNKHISKMIHKTTGTNDPSKKQRIVSQGQEDVALTSYEIDAQIHAIKQLKRDHADKWDDMSFEDMLDLNASLRAVDEKAIEGHWENKWYRIIKSRMAREGLLGKNMR